MTSLKSQVLPPPVADAQAEELSGSVLAEAFVTAMHEAAARMAGLASLVNMLSHPRQLRLSDVGRHLQIDDPRLLAAATRFARGEGFESQIAQEFVHLQVTLREPIGKLSRLCQMAAEKTVDGRWESLSKDCRQSWQALAADTAELVESLAKETEGHLSDRFAANSKVLVRLLRSIAGGEAACADKFGNIKWPELPQRRSAPRVILNQNCTLVWRATPSRAFARDVSLSGIGLTGAPSMAVNELVEVQLANGRRFKGMVVWTRDGRQGIRFETPLSWADPLLR